MQHMQSHIFAGASEQASGADSRLAVSTPGPDWSSRNLSDGSAADRRVELRRGEREHGFYLLARLARRAISNLFPYFFNPRP